MNSTSSNRNMSRRLLGIGGTLKLLAFQVILVATIASALVALQAGIASADTGNAPTQTQIQAIADDSPGSGTSTAQGGPDDCPFENNSTVNPDPVPDDISAGPVPPARHPLLVDTTARYRRINLLKSYGP